eukprot:363411-Chlamydomonas_euryale.AAC.13
MRRPWGCRSKPGQPLSGNLLYSSRRAAGRGGERTAATLRSLLRLRRAPSQPASEQRLAEPVYVAVGHVPQVCHERGAASEQVAGWCACGVEVPVVPQPPAAAPHQQRGCARAEAPHQRQRHVLLPAAVTAVHKQLARRQRRQQRGQRRPHAGCAGPAKCV